MIVAFPGHTRLLFDNSYAKESIAARSYVIANAYFDPVGICAGY